MPTIMKNGVPTYVSVEDYNKELAKTRKEVLEIDEKTGKLKHKTAPFYDKDGNAIDTIGKIWVNGQEFSGMAYQGLLTVNTKTYVDEPTRSNDGSIPNINDYDTFIVPRCKVNFKYFNIEDYQRLCDAIQSNEFVVKYYDKQFNEFVSHKMYCEPEEMAKLYNVGTDVFGLLDYEVSFIGTLNDLQELTVTYNANQGSIKGNPQPYDSGTTYSKDTENTDEPKYIAYLDTDPVDLSKRRYFKAIFYENSFTPKKDGQTTIEITNTNYWLARNIQLYSNTTQYNSTFSTTKLEKDRDIAYENVYDKDGKLVGRNYYIAIYENSFSGRPLTDSYYWQKISVTKYVDTNSYSSNKTSLNDTTFGKFVIVNDSDAVVYESIFYNSSFSGVDPTNTKYWSQMPLGIGITVKWGNSIVVADAEELFDAPTGKSSNSWTTNADGTGFTYYETQSLNVFKNLILYAKWE